MEPSYLHLSHYVFACWLPKECFVDGFGDVKTWWNYCKQDPPHLSLCSSLSKGSRENRKQWLWHLLDIQQTQVLFKTYLIRVGYVALSSIYPSDVEKWNSSQSKVIFPFSLLVLRVFDKVFNRKYIVQSYSSNSTLRSLKGVWVLTKA